MRINTPKDVADLAIGVMHTRQHEWFCGCLFTEDLGVLAVYRLCEGHACLQPIVFTQDVLLKTAKDLGAHTCITVRYHTHPWYAPTEEGLCETDRFRQYAKAHGCPLRDHLIVDTRGTVHSFRGLRPYDPY